MSDRRPDPGLRLLRRSGSALRHLLGYRLPERCEVFGHPVWVPKGVFHPLDGLDSTFFFRTVGLMVSPGHRVLDLGTGCGLGALIAASRGATVVACDVSKVAMDAAQRNVDAAGLADSVELRHGCGAEVVGDEVFDLIWCTPPQQPQRAEGEAQRATRAGEGHRDLVPILEAIPRWAGQRGRFVVLCDDDWGLESLIQRHCPEGFRSVQLAETLGALAHHRVLSLGYDLEAARVERHREEGRLRDGSAKAAVSRRRWEANSGSGSAEGGAAPDPEEQPTP